MKISGFRECLPAFYRLTIIYIAKMSDHYILFGISLKSAYICMCLITCTYACNVQFITRRYISFTSQYMAGKDRKACGAESCVFNKCSSFHYGDKDRKKT